MADPITIEALQAKVQKLERQLKDAQLEKARQYHELVGHMAIDFEHCVSPACVKARMELKEKNHGQK